MPSPSLANNKHQRLPPPNNNNSSVVVLTGFTYGYRDFLSNLLCRFQQLGIVDYAIAAFDADAYAWCRRRHGAACLLADEYPPPPPSIQDEKQAYSEQYGTDGFKAVTKLKSRQVLRLLERGHDVMWTDVDVFWTRDPLPHLLTEMGGDANLAVQSNAPPEEAARNGRRRINSGFYYVRRSEATVQAFRAIVAHAAARSDESEQPSFYSVLCGGSMEYAVGRAHCRREIATLQVTTYFLERRLYPNGAMLRSIGPYPFGSHILHFNWCAGREEKKRRFVETGTWLLDERGECK